MLIGRPQPYTTTQTAGLMLYIATFGILSHEINGIKAKEWRETGRIKLCLRRKNNNLMCLSHYQQEHQYLLGYEQVVCEYPFSLIAEFLWELGIGAITFLLIN